MVMFLNNIRVTKLFLNNSIIWNDIDYSFGFQEQYETSELTIGHSNIQGGLSGIQPNGNVDVNWTVGNINADPVFIDNYNLGDNSPCINTGTSIAFYQSGDGVVSDMGHLSGSGIFLDKIQVHFGYVALGENSNETIKIYNSRSENITLSGSSIIGPNDIFSYSPDLNTGSVTISPHTMMEVQMNFSPTYVGRVDGGLQITCEQILGGSQAEVPLVGNAFDLSSGVVQVPSVLPTIQEAIDALGDGDQILVAAGTYYENLIVDKAVSIIGEDRSNTILDGSGSGSVVYFAPNIGSDLVFKNFTVQNGTGRIGNNAASNGLFGGGIFIDENAAPLLESLIIQNNTAERGGAGIAKNTGGTLRISNSEIRYNLATGDQQLNGGGIWGDGGGYGSVIYNCKIMGNYASYSAGGIYLSDGPVISNCNIVDNYSDFNASALYANAAMISNCLITENGSNDHSDSKTLNLSGTSFIQNSLIWNNNASDSEENEINDNLTVQYSIIEGGQASFTNQDYLTWVGNSAADPLLNEDFTYDIGSPVYDMGNPNPIYNDEDGSRNDIGHMGGSGYILYSGEEGRNIFLNTNDMDFGYMGVGNSSFLDVSVVNMNNSDHYITGFSSTDNQFTLSSKVNNEYDTFPIKMARLIIPNKLYQDRYLLRLNYNPSSSGSHSFDATFSIDSNGENISSFSVSGSANALDILLVIFRYHLMLQLYKLL